MSITSLLQKGRGGRGVLERFADGCNTLARHLYLNRRVELIKAKDHFYLDPSNNLIRVEGHLKPKSLKREKGSLACGFGLAAADIAGDVPLLGAVAATVILLSLVITMIPATLAMGVGLAAKKIALATDEKSKEYDKVVKKYMEFLSKKKEAAIMQPLVDRTEQSKLVKQALMAPLKNVPEGQNDQAVAAAREKLQKSLASIENTLEEYRKKLEPINKKLIQMRFELLDLNLQDFEREDSGTSE